MEFHQDDHQPVMATLGCAPLTLPFPFVIVPIAATYLFALLY
jgi:hypothetical protein